MARKIINGNNKSNFNKTNNNVECRLGFNASHVSDVMFIGLINFKNTGWI